MHCLHFLYGANIYAAQHFWPAPPFFTCPTPPQLAVICKCWYWIYYAPSCRSWLSFLEGPWSVDFGDFLSFPFTLKLGLQILGLIKALAAVFPNKVSMKCSNSASLSHLGYLPLETFFVLCGRCHINHEGKRPTCNMLQALVNASFKVASAASTAVEQEENGEKKKIVARRGQTAIIVKPKPHKAILQGAVHTQWCVGLCSRA